MDTEMGREILINFADYADCKHDDCGMRVWLLETLNTFAGDDGKMIGVTLGLQQFLMTTIIPALIGALSCAEENEIESIIGSELALVFLYGQYVGANHGMVIPEMTER